MTPLLDELVSEKKKSPRRAKAEKDFDFFCREYLSDYFYTEPAEYQKVLYEIANTQSLSDYVISRLKEFIHEKYWDTLIPTQKIAGAIFCEPREHGKTVRWSFAYPLWRALTGQSKYLLLIGASGPMAKDNLINIKRELEENEKLMADFGDQIGTTWRDDRIELKCGVCLQAKGTGMSMRGTRYRQYRPDTIILDDLLKDKEVESPTQRHKIYKWLKSTVFNLGKTAFIVWVNTIFHSDDPISRLMKEVKEGTLKRFIAVRLSCFKPDHTPLWPENWPLEVLLEKKSQLGSDIFSTEYENEPISDEERIFRHDWIERHWYQAHNLVEAGIMRHFGGVDPSAGKHDLCGLVTIGVEKKGYIWELDSWGRCVSENEFLRQLVVHHQKWKYELIGWEDIGFQTIYARHVMGLAAEEGVYLPIRTMPGGAASKISRLRSLSPLIENGIIRLNKSSKDLIDQLVDFPKGRYDDIPDALWYAIQVANTGPGKVVIASGGRTSIVKSVLRGFRR